MDISVVILAYAEEDNLRILLPLIKHIMQTMGYKYEVIVIDGSEVMDGSDKICQLNQIRYVNQRYPGFGGAYRTAIEEADGKWLVTMDGDGSHNPNYIPAMLNMFREGNYDVVIGSRYVKGGSSDAGQMSVLMSRILNLVYRICLGIHAKDVSTNFRVYYTEQLKQIDLVAFHYDVLEEILVKLSILKGRRLVIGEIPIRLDKRISGQSKRRLLPFIVSYIKTLLWLMAVRIKSEEKRYE